MAADGVNITEDTEMAECDGEKVVTMMDVLQEQQEFEEDANAVLGASDDKNCTYAKGHIKRQAIYACLTCCPDAKTDPTKRAGVCLACSLNCHENHELVELYTKRNFRCDCGNPKFNSHPCQFTPNKTDLNDDNTYNQNFSGLYCTCHRPYPDPEIAFEDDMIQCIICEDWLHASHLDAVVPVNDQYSEMICKGCMDKNEFLHDYSNFAVNVESADVDIMTTSAINSANASHCNGNVSKDFGNQEAVFSNENDFEMGENKENIPSKKSRKSDRRISIARIEESRAIEQHNTEQTANSAQKDETHSEMNLDANNQEEPGSVSPEAKETCGDTKKEDESVTLEEKTPENENTEISNKTENAETDDTIQNNDQDKDASKELATKLQEQTEEQSKDDLKAGGDAETTDYDNNDINKTEDELLDDIKALTSDNAAEEPNLSTPESANSDNPSEQATGDADKPTECTEKEPEHEKSEETKESLTEQISSDSVESKSSESNDVDVPDTSQDDTDKVNLDDKTDSVMDAIDALLESTTEEKDSAPKEDNEQPKEDLTAREKDAESVETLKSNDVTMAENDDKVPENMETSTTDNNEKTDADAEMSESKIENEPPPNEEATADSEQKDDDSTSKIESTTDENKAEIESAKDIDQNSTVADSSAENETKPVSDDTSKIELSTDENKVLDTVEGANENKRKLSVELTEETSPKKVKLDIAKCVRPKGVKKVHNGATFWPSNFRQKLCTCGECISMYRDLHVLFLTDPEDTVSAYENLGKENAAGGASQYEKGLQALSSLDRIQQINALTEYNRMRDKLLVFLKSFKDRKEIVKEEDIKAFFAGMKPRREPDGVYFCR